VKNNKLLPFSRNRYYKGKMLTSADFEAEQRYMNDKRRFLNAFVTGSGIVCGLNVINLDDQSVMVESGMAIDDTGREIVVENAVVKKLSTIAGFDELKSKEVCLGIRYAETENQPVYAVNRQENAKDYENNRIEEGFELVLKDMEELSSDYEADTEFYTGGILFENEDYRIRLRMPSNLCVAQYVKLDIEIEKLSDVSAELFFEGVIQTPALSAPEGERELSISLENILLEKGKKTVREYWMLAQSEEVTDTSIMFKSGSGKAIVNGVEQEFTSQLNCRIAILNETVNRLSARKTGNANMEFSGFNRSKDMIRLAKLTLVKAGGTYFIEETDEKSIKEYVYTMKDAWKRQEYASYFTQKLPFHVNTVSVNVETETEETEELQSVSVPRLETGIVEIPIGENAKKGDVYYSDEIMHGLGAGNVYVEVGYEYLEEDPAKEVPSKATIYGNPDLFEDDMLSVNAQTAVKVLNDKGSFVVAVKLLRPVRMLVLTYRWVAIRYDNDALQDEMEVMDNQSISAVTPTIVLGTKESYFFQIRYNNMKECVVSYELTEASSGEITSDGIYTAPNKEGVYEIKIFCTDRPLICTYAYAIVKKKTVEEAPEETESEAVEE